MKSPFKGRKPTTTGHAQGHRVSRRDSKGLTALQQLREVGTVLILQRRDVELSQAWQDLSSVVITSVSSWPTLWC